jgi:MerR family transcriptional regulator, light-induced transcriptional regulator
MNAFTIKDLENLSGIKAHTIRIWEQRYGFLKPKRSDTNIRYYCNDELKTVLNIALLNKYGYKISHINRMTESELREKILSLSQAEALQERIINDLIHHMVDLNVEGFEDVLDGYIRIKGVDKTITQIIFPFLDKVGILWMTNHINIAQEHLVTNIIRQKLIVGIEGAVSHIERNKTALLFLPEGEQHELGLLYIYYLLKVRGVKVLYLGANLPVKDLEFVVKMKKPDILYSHITCLPGRSSFDKFMSQYRQTLSGTKMLLSGVVPLNNQKKLAEGVYVKRTLNEVLEELVG